MNKAYFSSLLFAVLTGLSALSPAAEVVKAGLDGLDRNQAIVIPGFANKAGAQASRWLPRSTVRRIIASLRF